jgi:large subunit ribosomal protein L17
MRHGNTINHLGRKYGHRSALLSNLANALIVNKKIVTTVAKAKELRKYVEPIITRSKDNSTHSRRIAFSYLGNKEAAKELFDVVGPKVEGRPGGYVRIIKAGFRPGDNAEMAYIELVDFNEVYTKDADKASAKKRTRRAGKKAAADAEVTAVTEEVSSEEAVSDEIEDVNQDETNKD